MHRDKTQSQANKPEEGHKRSIRKVLGMPTESKRDIVELITCLLPKDKNLSSDL